MDSFGTIAPFLMAGVLAFFVIKILPNAIQMIKHGPKGSSAEWLNGLLLLAAVGAFVFFLMSIT